MSTRELQQQLVENLKQWQKIENATITLTGSVIEATNNPLLCVLMEIIQRDSQMHHRVEQLIIDSLQSRVLDVSSADLGDVWSRLQSHSAMEKETVRLARASLVALEGHGLEIQELLLTYLRLEEEKHEYLLAKVIELAGAQGPSA